MDKNNASSRCLTILSVSLIILGLLFCFAPDSVSAADEDTADTLTKIEKLPESTVKENMKKAKAEALKDLEADGEAEDEGQEEEASLEAEELTEQTEDDLPYIKVVNGFDRLKKKGLNAIQVNDTFVKVTEPNSSGVVKLTCNMTQYYNQFGWSANSIYVDDELVTFDNDINGWYNFEVTINMKKYPVGYHTIYIFYNDGQGGILSDGEGKYVATQATYVPTYIYSRPSNSKSWYETKIKSFNLYYGGSSYSYDSSCKTYVFYKKGKGKWTKKCYGPVSTSSYSRSKRAGFKPNTKIQARLTYGKKFSYKGKTYAFTGRLTGKYSKAVTIKTAYKKPKVKSIKISGAKVKVYKWRDHYANRIRYVKSTGRIISVTPLYHTYKRYQTKFKVTVRFKKKQGNAGVIIRTKDLYATKYGDKKKYSVWFTLNGKKKGKKISVSVQSFRSKVYGGYSNKLKKKVKVKR